MNKKITDILDSDVVSDLIEKVENFLVAMDAPENREKRDAVIAQAVVMAFRTVYYRRAKKALKRGDYGTAIFWAIVWHGVSVVASQVETQRLLTKQMNKPEPEGIPTEIFLS